VIYNLGVLVDNRMNFVNHIESIVSKSASIFGFIKRISKEFNYPYTYKTLYVVFVRPVLEHASCVAAFVCLLFVRDILCRGIGSAYLADLTPTQGGGKLD
jgi:hypothetical protein